MFYSTEILCDKRYALSTIWRAGNTAPGARTTGIRRKAVLEVSVQKACGTIKEPPGAPIALRLQGTLLYGTARIYQEQCRYVLNDSERTQRALVKLCSGFLDDKLDRNAGKAKPVQIVLPNDPSFDLGFLQLPPFDFDAPPDASFLSQERQASWTNLSIGSRSSANTQLPQLVLDADSSGGHSYAGGFAYSASGASNLQDSPTPFGRGAFNFPEEENLLVDVGLSIDENGNIIEEEPQSEPQLPAFPSATANASKTGKATEDGAPLILDDEDGDLMLHPASQAAARANPFDRQPSEAGGTKHSQLTQTPSSPSTMSSSPAKVSKNAYRRSGPAKSNFVDEITQIPLREYFNCVTNYAQNMERAWEKSGRARAARRANNTALNRQAAYGLILGRGLFGVAEQVQAHCPDHPLVQMFSGIALEDGMYDEALARAKRRRAETAEPSTPVGRSVRGNLDGGFGDEQDIELGRQPASALSDNPSLAMNRHSSLLPGSSAHGSAQHSATGIRQLPDGRLSSAGGFPDSPSFIERYSDEDMELPPALAGAGVDGPGGLPLTTRPHADRDRALPARGSDALNHTVGEELRNTSLFFDLVQKKATEDGVAMAGASKHRWIEFGDVVAPFGTNRAAVVGAFMSLLALATSRALRIQQDDAEGDVIDRAILVGVPGSAPRGKAKGKGKKKRSFHEMSEADDHDVLRLASHDALMSGRVLPHSESSGVQVAVA